MLPACDQPTPLLDNRAGLVMGDSRPLRLLLVAHNLGEDARAGTESYVLHLGKALAALGVEVRFLAPGGPPASPSQEVIPWGETRLAGLPWLNFHNNNLDLVTLVRHPGFEAAFREILHRHPVEVVHFHHTYLSCISLLEVALEAGLPVVLTLHDAWHLCPRLHCITDQGFCGGAHDLEKCTSCLEPWLNQASHEARQKLLDLLARRRGYVQSLFSRCRVLAPSRFLRDLHYASGVTPGQIIHAPLGLDALGSPLAAPGESPPRFIFLGNIIPVKRVDLAVAAFGPLAGQASLDIWGGMHPTSHQSFPESLAPHSHIRYHGPYRREDLPRILAGAAAVVVCSDFENYPLVVRESLMLGVPVIAPRVGGVPEIVEHGKNGLLFPPGDAAALRHQVKRLLRRPELRERLRGGITPVKTMDQDARDLLGLYRVQLGRTLRPPSSPAMPPAAAGTSKPDSLPPLEVLPPPRPPASIIIPVWNNLGLTRNCLESIWEHTPPALFELILVDNGSRDATPFFLQNLAAAGRLRLITNADNLGYARACNQGARAARGDYLVMLNNDTLVTPGWLSALIKAVEGDPGVAVVGAKLLYPDDSVQHAGVVFNQTGKVYHLYRYLHRDHPAVNRTREFQVVTGACLLVRAAVFLEMGLFDENFRNGYEDVDLCLRARQRGHRVLYTPESVVYHLESQTPGRFDREKENTRYFQRKWGGRVLADDLSYYQEDGLRLEWTVDAAGQREAVIHDLNDNPFLAQARAHREQGEVVPALASYRLALRFNPFDPRNSAVTAELESMSALAAALPRTAQA